MIIQEAIKQLQHLKKNPNRSQGHLNLSSPSGALLGLRGEYKNLIYTDIVALVLLSVGNFDPPDIVDHDSYNPFISAILSIGSESSNPKHWDGSKLFTLSISKDSSPSWKCH